MLPMIKHMLDHLRGPPYEVTSERFKIVALA
jgi:hypothetical protein